MTAIFINEIKFHKCVYLEGNIKRKLPLYTEEKKQFLCMWKAVKIHLFVSTFTFCWIFHCIVPYCVCEKLLTFAFLFPNLLFVIYFIVWYLIMYVQGCKMLPIRFHIYFSLYFIVLYLILYVKSFEIRIQNVLISKQT